MRTKRKPLSLEEFLELPETEPASEYRDGRVTVKASPKPKHSLLQARWAQALNDLGRPRRLGLAFPELRCTFGGRSLVIDVAFLAWERIPRDALGNVEDALVAAPDLAIEIRSPRQSAAMLAEKLVFCVENGTRVGWLFDPSTREATVFRPGSPALTLAEGRLDASPVLPGTFFEVREVFDWLRLA